jgi:hypothetical protein
MSGFNVTMGVFELTHTKAVYWMRRKKLPDGFAFKEGELETMKLAAELLKFYDHQVIKLAQNFLRVKATPGQVWEALSGQPSNPERCAHYYTVRK